MIRAPRPDEIPFLPQIENTADERYARAGLTQVVDMPPATMASLVQGRRDGRLWVAASPLNRPVGFALMKLRGHTAWLDQLSVLPRWQGRGFGTALIDSAAAAAHERGFDTLYLSTYLGVPWNAPFYGRRGFIEVPRGKWPQAFRMQFMAENSHGHPSWRRTIMRRNLKATYLQLG